MWPRHQKLRPVNQNMSIVTIGKRDFIKDYLLALKSHDYASMFEIFRTSYSLGASN